jgi:SsrA-binding protein
MKLITNNKKAFFDYEFSEKIEAGIVLTGDEVKSLRAGHANLTGAFATIHQGQLTLLNCHISSYSHAYQKGEELSRRTRVLLVHKKQIIKLVGEISRKGVTLIPLKLYFNDKGKVKVEVGVGKHKKAHEKKETLRERDIKRETQRELRNIRA